MDTIKKLLIILSAVLLITLGFEHSAYASDITYSLDAVDVANTDTSELAETKKVETVDTSTVDIEAVDSESLDTDSLEEETLNIESLDAGSLEEKALEIESLDADGLEEEALEIESLDTEDEEPDRDIDLADMDLENINLEDINIEDIDLDKYQILFDEQDQMYIVKKEAEVVEPEKVEENKSEEKKAEKKTKKPKYSEKDLRLLASLVYSEAGNQSYKGMLAVANVVINRTKSDEYSHANNIKKVIYDKKWAVQFSVTVVSKKTGKSSMDIALELYDTGKIKCSNPEDERKAMEKAIKAAKAALEGENNIGKYLNFRMNNKGAASIKKKYDYKVLGDHIFYNIK